MYAHHGVENHCTWGSSYIYKSKLKYSVVLRSLFDQAAVHEKYNPGSEVVQEFQQRDSGEG